MTKLKIHPGLLIGILIAAFFGISLFFRIYLPYGKIFVDDWIKMSSIDVYFYMRLVDNLVYNFPHLTQFDPYLIYPGGGGVGSLSFFHQLQAGFIWIIGLGSPTQHTVDVVGAYFPTVLAALTIIPVYFIGKTLFNKWAGLLAAGLIAILPGEFMGRSILGGGDNPIAETLFTTTALAFLILAIKTAGQRQLSFKSIMERDWKLITRPLIYSLLAGIFLGMYLATWLGALLFVFIIALYFIIQFIVNHLHHKTSEHLCIIGFIFSLVSLLVFLPTSLELHVLMAMVIFVLIPLGLWGISRLMSGREIKTLYYPLTIIGVAIAAVVIIYAAMPGLINPILGKFNFVFFPLGSTAATTLEMQPFLAPQGNFSTLVAWGNFTTSFFIAPWWLIPGFAFAAICGYLYHLNRPNSKGGPLLLFLIFSIVVLVVVTVTQLPSGFSPDVLFIPGIALISLSILIYLFMKRRSNDQRWYISLIWVVVILILLSMLIILVTYRDFRYVALLPFAVLIYLLFKRGDDDEHQRLFILWTLLILIVAMIQRRFAYYLVVNIALLSAYLSWQVIWHAGLKNIAAGPKLKNGEAKAETTKSGIQKKRGITSYHVNTVLMIMVVLLFLCPSTIVRARGVASQVPFAPSDAWQSSLLWMKDNTPEPLGDPDGYYKFYEAPPPGENFTYPKSAYGVTSWWDYGYWISRIAHRIPNANPSQAPEPIKKIAAFFLTQDESLTREMMKELDSSYIIIDYAVCTSKFWAVVTWSGQEHSEFTDVYYLPYEGELVGVQLFYPKYYYTMLVRLYNFDGKAVTDVSPVVISYEEKLDQGGNRYKQVVDFEEFTSYQDALDYVESQESGNYRIVGINPFISPVSLEAVQNYNLVYSSESGIASSDGDKIPEVKIFEYLGD